MDSRMELLTSLGSAPKSLRHLGQLCSPRHWRWKWQKLLHSLFSYKNSLWTFWPDHWMQAFICILGLPFALASLFRRLGSAILWYTGKSWSATSCFSGRWISWAWGAGSSFLVMALLKKHHESCPVGQWLWWGDSFVLIRWNSVTNTAFLILTSHSFKVLNVGIVTQYCQSVLVQFLGKLAILLCVWFIHSSFSMGVSHVWLHLDRVVGLPVDICQEASVAQPFLFASGYRHFAISTSIAFEEPA